MCLVVGHVLLTWVEADSRSVAAPAQVVPRHDEMTSAFEVTRPVLVGVRKLTGRNLTFCCLCLSVGAN